MIKTSSAVGEADINSNKFVFEAFLTYVLGGPLSMKTLFTRGLLNLVSGSVPAAAFGK